jgi:hypothetical protein
MKSLVLLLLVLASVGAFITGMAIQNYWLAGAAFALGLATALFWAFTSTFGSVAAPGDNRPVADPTGPMVG